MVKDGGWDQWQVLDASGCRKYLSGDERTRFLQSADPLEPLERAFCHTLTYAGCRISEALALTIDHVDCEREALMIRTLKRRRLVFRMVPVPSALIRLLLELPLDPKRRFWTFHRVTGWRIVKSTMNHARISGPMACPKGLRHGFGIRAVDHNVPLNLIQRWLGHASPKTTIVYTDAVGTEERQFARRMW